MRVLGSSWTRIAPAVRQVHSTRSVIRLHGRLRIEGGGHRGARLLAWMLRLPRPDGAAYTRVTITARDDGELWERTFNGRRLDTRQYESGDGDLAERFGVLEFRFRLEESGGSLLYTQRDASLLCGPARARIPASLAPRVEAREDPAGPARITVRVRVAFPFVGPLLTYDGVIDVEDPPG
jgi:uncharacterized protein DUF4166